LERDRVSGAQRLEAAMRRVLSVGLHFPLVVVAAWVVAAAALSLLVTPLSTVVERSSTAFLPDDSPTQQGLRVMDSEFGSGRTESYMFIVIADEGGLDAADQRLYETLVQRLEQEPERVAEVQDYIGKPDARKVLTSDDGKATYIVVGMPSAVGSPESDQDVKWLRALLVDLDTPAGTRVHVTGDPAMISDLTTAANQASARITVVSLLLLVSILWLI
jgi:RND superfamily putative drug exporter